MLVLIETEIWPNLLREAERAQIPVVLVNGRVSERHAERYRRFANSAAFARLCSRPCRTQPMRSESHCSAPDRIHTRVTGNLKYDAVTTNVDAHLRNRLRAQHGIPGDAPVLVIFGSTRPGDEVRGNLLEIIAGDHPRIARGLCSPPPRARGGGHCGIFRAVLRRSALGAFPNQERVHCVDTHGDSRSSTQSPVSLSSAAAFRNWSKDTIPSSRAALGVPCGRAENPSRRRHRYCLMRRARFRRILRARCSPRSSGWPTLRSAATSARAAARWSLIIRAPPSATSG